MRGRIVAAVEIRPEEAGREATLARGVRPGRITPHLTLLRGSPTAESAAATRTDGELVTLALNGAAAAFSDLMRRHARHVHAVIARRLRNPEDVRDAVQDTHLAVWRALHHYDAGRPFEAWITTIALNKCRDAARRRAAQLGMLSRLRSDVIRDGWCASEERGIERQLIGKESMRCLGTALRALPPQLRAPLLLTAVREHSQAAAARELGLTRKAVEMRVRRARQHLARALEPTHA
ncbi:MAG TPA: sigma-70 family RNA polymerase sigma factor [Steroidobacteraceae bacterium]